MGGGAIITDRYSGTSSGISASRLPLGWLLNGFILKGCGVRYGIGGRGLVVEASMVW